MGFFGVDSARRTVAGVQRDLVGRIASTNRTNALLTRVSTACAQTCTSTTAAVATRAGKVCHPARPTLTN